MQYDALLHVKLPLACIGTLFEEKPPFKFMFCKYGPFKFKMEDHRQIQKIIPKGSVFAGHGLKGWVFLEQGASRKKWT